MAPSQLLSDCDNLNGDSTPISLTATQRLSLSLPSFLLASFFFLHPFHFFFPLHYSPHSFSFISLVSFTSSFLSLLLLLLSLLFSPAIIIGFTRQSSPFIIAVITIHNISTSHQSPSPDTHNNIMTKNFLPKEKLSHRSSYKWKAGARANDARRRIRRHRRVKAKISHLTRPRHTD